MKRWVRRRWKLSAMSASLSRRENQHSPTGMKQPLIYCKTRIRCQKSWVLLRFSKVEWFVGHYYRLSESYKHRVKTAKIRQKLSRYAAKQRLKPKSWVSLQVRKLSICAEKSWALCRQVTWKTPVIQWSLCKVWVFVHLPSHWNVRRAAVFSVKVEYLCRTKSWVTLQTPVKVEHLCTEFPKVEQKSGKSFVRVI